MRNSEKRRKSLRPVPTLTEALLAVVVMFGAIALGGAFSAPAGASGITGNPTWPNMSTTVNCVPPQGTPAGTPCTPTPVQPGGLDHFLCYPAVGASPVPPAVQLIDQFGTHDPVPIVPGGSAPNQELCNPADKTLLSPGPGGLPGTSYPPSNPNGHLYCYDDATYTTPSDPGGYMVSNQFGTYVLNVTTPTSLCLPSYKFNTQLPPSATNPDPTTSWGDPSTLELNHFQCYDVSLSTASTLPTPPTIQLQDEFGTFTSVQVDAPNQLVRPGGQDGGGRDGNARGTTLGHQQ